jgi:hypothetical protein
MRKIALVVGLVLLPTAVRAQPAGLPSEIQAGIEENKKACGEPVKLKPGFIVEKDINGDGVKDYILDYGKFVCGDSETYFCGSAGCTTEVYASVRSGGYVKVLEENVRGLQFRVVSGRPAMLLALHGSACGKVGAAPCNRTLYWNGQTFK